MHRNKSVDVHQFAMVPRSDIPRSSFRIETSHKSTIDAGYLVPVYVDEVLPGDTFNVHMTAFGRLATPIVPIMDNLHLESFFFFVPTRLVWSNFRKFMGERDSPSDSIDYTIPQCISPTGGWAINSLGDYFGLPTAGQVLAPQTISHSALPLRCYNLIWFEWFRDENLQPPPPMTGGDGPDVAGDYNLLRRGKRHDYFTSCLPWVQKGSSVTLPLGTSAPVKTAAQDVVTGPQYTMFMHNASTGAAINRAQLGLNSTSGVTYNASNVGTELGTLYPTNLYADLSAATAATINQIRQAFQIQKLLERDARGGTRYTEIVRSHFGVISPDARLQRPEYLGGGHTMVNVAPIAQTSGTGQTGQTTPLGFLSAVGTVTAHGHGFTQSFTEHGYVIGLVSIRADLSYQQGLRKLWSRKTRYDFYFPVFAMLGEQAVLNKEIYCDGSVNDDAVFGYQERWAEYRYHPAMITGLFRSTAPQTLDVWHLSQKFTSLPTLNSTFISDNPPVDRIVATTPTTGKQFLLDCFFSVKAARPLPMYSVPGLVDHF